MVDISKILGNDNGVQFPEDDFNNDLKVDLKQLNIRLISLGRKKMTYAYGFDHDLDLKRICKAMKKEFGCNGTYKKEKDFGEVIKLQGDQRKKMLDFLYDNEIYLRSEDRIHLIG